MAIKTNENFITFSNSVTFRKPRGTDLVTASELIPGFYRSKSNVPTHDQKADRRIVSGIKPPPLARTPPPPPPPPPHGIYIDRCIRVRKQWDCCYHVLICMVKTIVRRPRFTLTSLSSLGIFNLKRD